MKSSKKEQEICIVFSRYPRAGASKTRLIPHLGPAGAAELQRRMTEHVVAVAGRLAIRDQVHLELAMAGAAPHEMAAWLGRQWPWQEQVGADLGERMAFAIGQAFRRGFQRVVLVGADCPGLSTDILAQAFQKLQQSELVLGPTMDGGYYLIGLSRPLPALFEDIPWGSAEVLAQTMAAAHKARLQPALLARLTDVDRPEDLDGLAVDLLSPLP